MCSKYAFENRECVHFSSDYASERCKVIVVIGEFSPKTKVKGQIEEAPYKRIPGQAQRTQKKKIH